MLTRYHDPVPALKRELAAIIVQRMAGWRRHDGAVFLGVDGARLSNIRNGRLECFALQGLVRMLARLGDEITITVTPAIEVRRRERLAALARLQEETRARREEDRRAKIERRERRQRRLSAARSTSGS